MFQIALLTTIINATRLFSPNVEFRLEARDGFRSDSKLLAHFYADVKGMSVDWDFRGALKAESGFLLIQLVNAGNPAPQLEFSYFV